MDNNEIEQVENLLRRSFQQANSIGDNLFTTSTIIEFLFKNGLEFNSVQELNSILKRIGFSSVEIIGQQDRLWEIEYSPW